MNESFYAIYVYMMKSTTVGGKGGTGALTDIYRLKSRFDECEYEPDDFTTWFVFLVRYRTK